jgi:hypothetical protein
MSEPFMCPFVNVIQIIPDSHCLRSKDSQLAHHKSRKNKYCIMQIICVSQ